jgi:hypothetical protein
MKKNLILAVMAILSMTTFANGAFADAVQAVKTHNDFTFNLGYHDGWGNEIYFNCDSVEDYTQSLLAKLGATNVKVNCMGGIDPVMPFMPPVVSVSFDSVRAANGTLTGAPVNAAWSEVKIHDFDNCFLATSVLNEVKDHFEIRDLKGADTCSDTNGSYHFSMTALMAQ